MDQPPPATALQPRIDMRIAAFMSPTTLRLDQTVAAWTRRGRHFPLSEVGEKLPGADSGGMGTSDLWGMLLSLGCVLHCLAAPVALIWLPLQTVAWMWSPALHAVVAVVTMVLVGCAVAPGYRRHQRPEIPFLATLGCGLVVLGSLWPCSLNCDPWLCLSGADAASTATAFASWWTPAGAILLVVMHAYNSLLSRRYGSLHVEQRGATECVPKCAAWSGRCRTPIGAPSHSA